MDYLMAIDLGSTSIKAMVFDLGGQVVSSASQPTEKVIPADHPDWIVWDPEQIWQSVIAVTREAIQSMDDVSLLRGLAVTGMGMDGVPVDEKGTALYPFISWHDARTAEQAQWWQETIGSERSFSITGFPSWAITGVMRILWMQKYEPEIMQRTHKWLLIEDYINCRLSGVMATDQSMASCMLLMDQAQKQWSPELVQTSGIKSSLLPDIRPSASPLGKVTNSTAQATGLPVGLPVILGGHDHICGALAAGLLKPGRVLDIMGTWESVQTVVTEPVLTNEVFQADICMQAHVTGRVTVAWGGAPAGESLEWFRREWAGGESWESLLTELQNTQSDSQGILYLPHISAAACPISDPKSLGAFIGLRNSSSRADLLRAVIEGLNYQFLHIVATMEQALDTKLTDVCVTGGVTQNEFWIQNKADMLGLPVQVLENKDASPLGAALLAGLGLGLYKNPEEAYDHIRPTMRTYKPREDLTPQYQRGFELYKRLYPALKPLHHDIFDHYQPC